MPYIDRKRRHQLPSRFFRHLPDNPTAGDLNYLFIIIANEYVDCKGLRYATCNDIMGALQGAQSEFYRRTVAPYEDQAIRKNGDVRRNTWQSKSTRWSLRKWMSRLNTASKRQRSV